MDFRSSNFDVSHSGIELIPGIRYNVNLKEDKRLFLDVGLNINLTLSQSFSSEAFRQEDRYALFESNKLSSSIGVGYSIKKISVYLKYYLPVSYEGSYYSNVEDIIYKKTQTFESKMQSYSLQVAYQLF